LKQAAVEASGNRVCAVVVTFNRKELLTECLRALEAQLRPVNAIVIVDNASTDGTRDLLSQKFPDLEVLALPRNRGGAGGFYEGMKWAFEQGYDWIWLMDDDGRPAENCLHELLSHQGPNAEGKAQVLTPMQRDRSGRSYGAGVWDKFYVDVSAKVNEGQKAVTGNYLFAFVGPLISREVVKRIGLPRHEFFIWFDDYEYGLRIHRAIPNSVTVVPSAVFHHDIGGKTREVRMFGKKALRNDSPAWKTYYGSRNHLFTVLRTRRSLREVLWFGVRETWLLTGDLMFETDRWRRAWLRLRGIRDGLFGRMGKRI
jgi:rhamnopyranosyl-N-acetylglucosaminyl-diphospho-decaprenol beta-1,3/1,4-galactofuranosyltransferase